jgi:two-component system NtrC family sensor kinase
MPKERILIITSDPVAGENLEQKVLSPAGYMTTFMSEGKPAEQMIKAGVVDLVLLGSQLMDGSGLAFARQLACSYVQLPLIWIAHNAGPEDVLAAMRAGFWDILHLPPDPVQTVNLILRCMERQERMRTWMQEEAQSALRSMRKHLDSVETLQRIGRAVTSLLDLDAVLTAVVDAAVEMTGAEEGSLLLLDEQSGELYMRAARNFQEDFVRKFRLPMHDSLAGQVLRTGQPLTLNETAPQKIKTAYLVHTLIYMPLTIHGRVIGVLGVDNRQSGHPFLEEHLALVSSLADYAAIAVENARAYERTELGRSKLDTILTNVEDGVLVVDQDGKIVLANHTAQAALNLDQKHIGRPALEYILQEDMIDLINLQQDKMARREVKLDDGRTFNAQRTSIPGIGIVITMQDITHLKELDRIKSEFVSNVSHDLRSPLTAILGYIELIDRVGPLTEQQKEFIQRVQISVHNITSLINDLLDLGRIEAGFDTRFEPISFVPLIQDVLEIVAPHFLEKKQHFVLDVPGDLPMVLGNPARLRQMLANLLGNAHKYTPQEGQVSLRGRAEGAQVILQVIDNGPGIPPSDQPYIFDKFYRASNIPEDAPGTGLGLSIVRSIVENHGGRIWVESAPGQGTKFTVVFPVLTES